MRVRILPLAVLSCVLALTAARAEATTISFENVAPGGSLINVNPAQPYIEAGFTLTPSNDQSAVFDSAAAVDMPGNATDFFGFAESNIITMTFSGGAFDFASVLVGRNTGGGGNINMTIVGTLAGGGTVNVTVSDVSTATLAQLNWTNLSSVEFRTTDDSGIDNLVVNDLNTPVPEPSTWLLIGTGIAAVAARRRFTKKA